VRLYLDDGSFTITDAEGRYSMYGISPRTHALKVDPNTLPAGARAISCDARGQVERHRVRRSLERRAVPRRLARAGDSTLADIARAPRRAARRRRGRSGARSRTAARRSIRAASSPTPARCRRGAILTGEGRLPLFPRARPRAAATVCRRTARRSRPRGLRPRPRCRQPTARAAARRRSAGRPGGA
jgi:hypothetical protein